jgi:hypothetical protein
MTGDIPENRADLQGIYQGEITPTLGELLQKFKPWHKPRKHFVRLEQWCGETRKLLKNTSLSSREEIRYLGLPADDMLDIRVMEGVCKSANVKLRYLGFNSSLKSSELNLSKHQVNASGFIHQSSVVIADRIENLAKQQDNSMARQYLLRHAPFDVINLDLCNSVTYTDFNGSFPYLEAIRTICDVQLEQRRQPWLMFLTTRTARGELPDAMKKLFFSQLLENLKDQAFSGAMQKNLTICGDQIRAEVEATNQLVESAWVRAYVLSLSKWLLHYMMDSGYKCGIRMLPSYIYSVQTGLMDMVSTAFICEPPSVDREDNTGLTALRLPTVVLPPTPTEPDLAIALLEQIAAMQDLDKKLKDDERLLEKFLEKSSSLMAAIGYDAAAYRKFAKAP